MRGHALRAPPMHLKVNEGRLSLCSVFFTIYFSKDRRRVGKKTSEHRLSLSGIRASMFKTMNFSLGFVPVVESLTCVPIAATLKKVDWKVVLCRSEEAGRNKSLYMNLAAVSHI